MVAATVVRQKYMVYLDDEQQNKKEKIRGERRKLIKDEIKELKERNKR